MLTNVQPYPYYRPSYVNWLGYLPEHWEVRRLKQVCQLAYGDSLSAEDRIAGDVPVYGSNGQIGVHNAANTLSPCIIVGRKGSFGKVTYLGRDAFAIDTTFFIDDRYTDADLGWLAYALALLGLDSISHDSAVPGLNRNDAYESILPLPPLPEQWTIVRYLDHVDRRIRRYVDAKRKLITLLEEEKQAVINQAVTRGLDPNVRLKPSGAEWLGDVPEHWDVLRVGRFSKIGNGSTPSRGNAAYWTDGVHPWLNSSSVNQGVITRADQFVTDLALRECHLPRLHPGSVLVGITGQGKTRGMAAVLSIDATINQHMAFITPDMTRVSSHYLQMCLTAAYSELRAISDDSGSTKGALTCEDIKRFKVVLPPREEQDRLVSEVRREFAGVDATIGRTRRQIELVQEYRTRLIADVVTGKLDVREAAEYLPDEAEDDTPIGESDPQQNGLAEVFHVAEEEIAIAEEVTI